MKANASKKNTVNASSPAINEENAVNTENTATAPATENTEATVNTLEAATQNELPATEENGSDELTEESIPEEVRVIVWPLVQQKQVFQAQIGNDGPKLEILKGEVAELQESLKNKQEEIKTLTEKIAVPQVRVNQIDKMIKDLMAPVTLKARVGVVKTAKAATSGPSDRALNTALEILSEIARIADVNEFKSEHLQQAKGCGRDTAGGILHRWEGAGIIERKSVGVYGIAPQYAGLI